MHTKNKNEPAIPEDGRHIPVAIVGMGCFFPKSSGLKGYWRLLFNGEDAIREIPETHWNIDDYFHQDPKAPDHVYCKRGGFLSPVNFDPSEFGIPPATLEATDTSQLLSLLAAKTALNDAGYDNGKSFDKDRASVIIGVTGTQELVIPLGARLGHPKWRKALVESGVDPETTEEVIRRIADAYVPWQENSFPGLLGNVVAGRICNKLDLGGTNCVVDAACASSMSAINLALMELTSKRSDIVITGGADAINDIFMHMCFSKTQILSASGDARPFSANADGTVLGEGIGLFVLKRLEDAERDGDKIYAVIRGIGASSDGKSQSIYAPRADGQLKALTKAYAAAGVDPNTVEMVEAHGTGTRVGDAVEFESLSRLFESTPSNGNMCALGSVKSMIGHTKAAAGAAGMMKAVLALYHKVLLPTLKIDEPDPKLDIQNSPFYLNTASRPWLSRNNHPRRAGVSAFGFGGSNFHVLLEEYQQNKAEIAWDGKAEIAAFSASTLSKLKDRITSFQRAVTDSTSTEQTALAFAQTRKRFLSTDAHRIVLIRPMPEEEPKGQAERWIDPILKALDQKDVQGAFQGLKHTFYGTGGNPGKLAFVFPGQGSQYVNMGKDLVNIFPEAFEVLENANRQFAGPGLLSDLIFPSPDIMKAASGDDEKILRHTQHAQPAIGSTSLGMLKIIEYFGLLPDATCGHSYGELTALFAAGCMDEDMLLQLSVKRGACMAQTGASNNGKTGGMLAVKAPLDELEALIGQIPEVVLANRNSPNQGVLSGTIQGIENAEAKCKSMHWRSIRLPVSAAFHSSQMQNACGAFQNALSTADFSNANMPVYANTTGKPYPQDVEKIRQMLVNQLVNPVDFVGSIVNMHADGVTTFVEVGPKTVLTGLIRSILNGRDFHAMAVDASNGRNSGIMDLGQSLCRLAALGYPVGLERWESPVPEITKQRMTVPITGANIRTSQAKTKKTAPIPLHDQPLEEKANPIPKTYEKPSPAQIPGMKTEKPRPLAAQQSLQVLSEGLRSMQALQMETAEAHKTFLQHQTEIAQTLRRMMENAGIIAEVPSMEGLPKDIDTVLPEQVTAVPEPLPAMVDKNASPPPDQLQKEDTSTKELSDIQSVLLEVVGELTGYPREMMGMDMDIESDLGIDSIKRVEILSVLEERIPGLPTVSPEMMGDLKTLGHIVDYMARSCQSESNLTAPVAPSPIPAEAQTNHPEIAAMLMDVVSDLTGYPKDMLAPEMDIEADLGIDSIKRVEILSTMEEKMPGLPAVTPEMMGDLKTLGQITAYLSVNGEIDTAAVITADTPHPSAENNNEDGIASALLAVVSQLTGYPEDMLALNMDIEADLGIDSIKRVEILSTMEEKMPGLPTVTPEMMGDLKTLGQIITYLSHSDTMKQQASQTNRPVEVSATAGSNPSDGIEHTGITRQAVRVDSQPRTVWEIRRAPTDLPVWVTDDGTALAGSIVDTLNSNGIPAEKLSRETVVQIIENPPTSLGISGLLILQNPDSSDVYSDLSTALQLAKVCGASLMNPTQINRALFATLTRMDGAFGFINGDIKNPISGGLAGLAKTASIEWEKVSCRAIDIAPEWPDIPMVATAIVTELFGSGPSNDLEVGLMPNTRNTLTLPDERLPIGDLPLKPRDVVLISGGARGITAEAARHLAARIQPTLVLLGRSPEPAPEPPWLSALDEPKKIKQAILEHEFSGTPAVPADIEASFQNHMAGREIQQNLAALRATGATVVYRSLDVRDSTSVHNLVGEIRESYGPIRGIIHAAGVLQDRLIVDKTAAQFDQVFNTKVKGLENLLSAARAEPLKVLTVFSSVSARFGNKGQVDYAMANEALNKMAQKAAYHRPDCRVTAINWGPWDGGMVTPGLKKAFQKRNISLIPVEVGAAMMLDEMAAANSAPVEVVIGERLEPEPSRIEKTIQQEPSLQITAKRELDIAGYPVLNAHILDGKPVVPMALIAEWLGHGALHGNPGLVFEGLEDLRLLHGIKLDQAKKMIRLMAGAPVKKGNVYEVPVEIRDGIQKDGTDLIHSSAKAILSENPSNAPAFQNFSSIVTKPYSKSLDEVYRDILFHGEALRGISEILGYSHHGIVAKVCAAPPPNKWLAEPLRSRWIGDPLVMDAAFQMAIIWSTEEKGMRSLPTYIGSYRQYRSRFPDSGVTAVMTVESVSTRKLIGNFTFLSSDQTVIARISGYEAVMDPSLAETFKRRHAA